MRIGQSYKQTEIEGVFDGIVIGSGPGGLALAAILARHSGKRILVLERHYTAGGFSHTFSRPGFEWDVGVHYVGDVHIEGTEMNRVFRYLTEDRLSWADMGEIYDTIVIGDTEYPLRKTRDAFATGLKAQFPDEHEAIDRYLSVVRAAMKTSQFFFASRVIPWPISPVLAPLLNYPSKKYTQRTTDEVLRGITNNARLRAVLAGQYGDYGLPPQQSSFFMHALVANHYFGGGAYPVGGSAQIAAGMLPTIEQAGGMVVTNAEVDQIVVEDGRAVGVRLFDGRQIRAPWVASDAGIANTVGKLLPPEVASRTGLGKKIEALGASTGHLSLYLGLDKTAEELGLGTSNLWVYPGEDHDKNCARYLDDPSSDLPVVYISFPSAKDPSFQERFPGKSTIELVTLSTPGAFDRWRGSKWKKRGEDYDALKGALTEKLMQVLLKHRPQVEGHIVHSELSTPLSTAHFSGFSSGEIYGLTHTPERFAASWLKPSLPVRGLYLTGADASTAGVCGATAGAILAASSILRRNMMSAVINDASVNPA